MFDEMKDTSNAMDYIPEVDETVVDDAVAEENIALSEFTDEEIQEYEEGALSGKDGTKVDRSGAYMARYIAKNIVAAKLADECTVSVAYAIGKAEPVAVFVDTHETGKYGDYVITEAVKNVFDMTPAGIIRAFGLNRPIFEKTAANGHFADTSYPWEQINRRDELRIICSDINRERKYA